MTARLLDGKALAAELRNESAVRAERLRSMGVVPGLAVVLVGDDAASQVYVRNKARACEQSGLHSEVHALPASTSQATLLSLVRRLDADARIHGILVQLPLPPGLDGRAAVAALSPEKDVDGFHYENLGALVAGNPAFRPCTPAGVMALLEHDGVALEGKRACVVGRSTIVGKPMALMLLQAGATVTVAHSKTRDLGSVTREADVLVVAVGRPGLVTASMVKPGAVVIDVGVNRVAGGGLAGDVDFAGVREVAGAITPVPGGVGPMTIAMLIANTVRAAERRAGIATRMETRIA